MMEAVHTSETLVSFNMTTLRYIPENSKLLVASQYQVLLLHLHNETVMKLVLVALELVSLAQCGV
jgi:hypothetical protein